MAEYGELPRIQTLPLSLEGASSEQATFYTRLRTGLLETFYALGCFEGDERNFPYSFCIEAFGEMCGDTDSLDRIVYEISAAHPLPEDLDFVDEVIYRCLYQGFARAALVSATNPMWKMSLLPGERFTCITADSGSGAEYFTVQHSVGGRLKGDVTLRKPSNGCWRRQRFEVKEGVRTKHRIEIAADATNYDSTHRHLSRAEALALLQYPREKEIDNLLEDVDEPVTFEWWMTYADEELRTSRIYPLYRAIMARHLAGCLVRFEEVAHANATAYGAKLGFPLHLSVDRRNIQALDPEREVAFRIYHGGDERHGMGLVALSVCYEVDDASTGEAKQEWMYTGVLSEAPALPGRRSSLLDGEVFMAAKWEDLRKNPDIMAMLRRQSPDIAIDVLLKELWTYITGGTVLLDNRHLAL